MELMSQNIDQLAAALAKAQPKMKSACKDKLAKVKTKSGGEYSYEYADLGGIIDACQEPLAENGLSICQMTTVNEGRLYLTSYLLHLSGQWMKSVAPLIYDINALNPNQELGKAITYQRKYAWAALAGVYAGGDEDANTMSSTKKEGHVQKNEENKHISKEQFAEVVSLIEQCEQHFIDASLKRIKSEGAKGWESMPAKLFPIFKEAAERHIAKKQHEVANAK